MKLRYSGSAVGVWWVAPFAIEHWVASTECVDPMGGWHLFPLYLLPLFFRPVFPLEVSRIEKCHPSYLLQSVDGTV